MSYDLFFTARSHQPSQDELRAWFAEDPRYIVTRERAGYENDATGIYFGFDFMNMDDGSVPVAFNLNYYRPHVFALEAEPELTAFVERFDLDVSDPQRDGMGDGRYSASGFFSGWSSGNRFAHEAILTEHRLDPLTLPRDVLRRVWQWNYHKPAYTDLLCSVEMTVGFVPTIQLIERDSAPNEVVSAVLWSDAMPIALPQVDFALLAGSLARGGPCLVPMAEIWEVVAPYPTRPGYTFEPDGVQRTLELPHVMIDHEETPPGLLADLAALARPPESFVRIHIDQVLDRELVDEVLHGT